MTYIFWFPTVTIPLANPISTAIGALTSVPGVAALVSVSVVDVCTPASVPAVGASISVSAVDVCVSYVVLADFNDNYTCESLHVRVHT